MLTPSEAAALRNLADKKSGSVTAFVKIADARRLTDLGLAERSRQGWDITAAGATFLTSLGPLPSPEPETLHADRPRLSLAPDASANVPGHLGVDPDRSND